MMLIDFVIGLIFLYYAVPFFLKLIVSPEVLPYLTMIVLGLIFVAFWQTPEKKKKNFSI